MIDVITGKEAHIRTLWSFIPDGIKHAIKNAVKEGKWSIDVVKDFGLDGERSEVDKKILNALRELGYTIYNDKDKTKSTYRISWELLV